MSAEKVPPGCLTLSGLVSLENRHAVPKKPYTFIYDASFTCADTPVDGRGSFRCYAGRDKTKKQDDTYEVRTKIIAYKPGHHIKSDSVDESKINVLGEINSMQPLSVMNGPDLDDTIRISGSGIVTSVEADPPSFLIHATQYIDRGQSTDEFAVRGRLDNNPKWADPMERIPQPNSIIRWNGILLRFDTYTPPGKNLVSCIVVATKDITYIFTPDKTAAKTAPKRLPADSKSNLRQQVKSRTRSQHSSNPSTSQASTSPGTSQSHLGKRKSVNSADEVNDNL
ncbi:hypothetical protein EDB84DRAFT_1567746 [Lactarius hengduanensis]|nr:hypothetical protein EDB84DRAFT_1567746 [Lactarius hengduanensis]